MSTFSTPDITPNGASTHQQTRGLWCDLDEPATTPHTPEQPRQRRQSGAERAIAVLANLEAQGVLSEPDMPVSPEEIKLDIYPHGEGRFEVSSEGVYWCKGDATKKRVCDELRIEAKSRDAWNGAWGLLLAWKDSDGYPHRPIVHASQLGGDGMEAIKLLLDGGLHIDGGQAGQKHVREYLQVAQRENGAAARTLRRVRTVEKLGWHGGAYVTPSGTIGDTEGESIVFQGAGTSAEYGRSGTPESWREHVATPSAGNSRLVMALCCSFAGPLLGITGEESGGLHLMGESSCGKTTALKVAGSVHGNPRNYVRQWRATANGLEGVAAVHNDGTLILDELGQCDGKEAGSAAYMLANGGAKVRMSKAITVRPSVTWRVLFLSSGEISLTTLVESTGKRAKAGQELRLATIPADAGAGHGLFEDLHGHESGHTFSSALGRAASEHHGTVGDAFLAKLVQTGRENAEGLKQAIREGIDAFVKEYAPPGASGQALRIAQRFGLLSAAGQLATAWGLTGWKEDEADRGCGACYRAWLECSGPEAQEDRKLVEQVRAFIEKHGASRFQDSTKPDAFTVNRAGYWRLHGETRQYLVTPETFKEMVEGHDTRRATKVLQAKGLLLPGGDGKSSQVLRIPASGQNVTRVYVIVALEEVA